MTDVFISYKREERPKARAIAEAIASRGYDVWWDVELLPGDRFADEIEAVIRTAKAAIVLWSEASVISDFVRAEAYIALQKKILIPVRLDDADIPLPFGSLQVLDLRKWDGTASDRKLKPLLTAIAKRTEQTPAKIAEPSKIETMLDRHSDEAVYWKSISEAKPQSADEYRAYLERFGDQATFSDLARMRIKKLDAEKRNPWPKIAKIMAGATAVVGLVAGGLKVADQIGLIGQPPPTIPSSVKEKPDKSTNPRKDYVIRTRNDANKIDEKNWRWTVYLDATEEVIGHITCVEYILHRTFPNRRREVCEKGTQARPFALTATGWGTFTIDIRVFFDNGSFKKLNHQLKF